LRLDGDRSEARGVRVTGVVFDRKAQTSKRRVGYKEELGQRIVGHVGSSRAVGRREIERRLRKAGLCS
jgi:hypothetical protein